MIYDYYCSHCGKQLNQNTVLFDMQYLLTCDDTLQFNILKIRMNLAELKAMMAEGTASEHGYKTCRLTMAQIMGYISNKNNLDEPSIAALTMEEISEYMKASTSVSGAAQQVQEDDYYDSSDGYEEETVSTEPAVEYVKPASITALENKSKALVDEIFIKDLLTGDLSVLAGIFEKNNTYEFQIREENDYDNDEKPVMKGYSMKSVGGFLKIEARVCSKCDTKVFPYAGTAKHQSVAFIGSPKAGKTSTIVALTHYAIHYMNNGFGGNGVWKDCQIINTVDSVELLDKTAQLGTDLMDFGRGVAPKKTPDMRREDAYSVTFRLSNSAEGNKRYLFTLTDLPGELCVENGDVQWKKVQDLFPVALSSDAFVLCVDSQSLANTAEVSPTEMVANVCKWADQFQSMRAQHNGLNTYVPTMVLFTKCEELEDPNAPAPVLRGLTNLDRMYSLKVEKQQIALNKRYQLVSSSFSKYGHLDKAYHAMMRCSPFGYSAPDAKKESEMTEEEKNTLIHPPLPKNIDYLMRWLLSVSGCIPTEAFFAIKEKTTPYTLQNFCISRPQLRSQNPGYSNKIDDIKESMARCALFENSGYFDRKFVANHNAGQFVLGPIRWMANLHPNTNDRQG